MTREARPRPWMRAYSLGLGLVLVLATVVLVLLAATSEPGERGRFGGLAVIVGALAVGAVALLWALEKRWRALDRDA
ncbi:hypothetical protein [Nocardioides sp. Soil805]|uniref:hypothetical protein n=1 Tax=Nocardioides sp. Soil805 TaxID=1736416 RepID=UPI0012E34934|nr:hypothetical protein [Nocardioides sp. Soil805]